jgi:crossover junction endodeoxyribonuclease RuvC
MSADFLSKDDEIILGIDPGTRVTGYGIIKKNKNLILPLDFGCIRPPAKYDLHKRYLIIYESVFELIQKFKPSSMSIETQFVKKNVQSAIKLGMARGVIIIAGAKNNVPIYEYAPKKAKMAVVGNGKASKHQVQKMIQMILNLKNISIPEDAADALALAVCHAHQYLPCREKHV